MKDLFSKEAVLMSSVPILSFVFAFAFELGYADAFRFSISLVDIDLKIIVIALFVVFIVLYPLFMYVEALYGLGSSEKITSRYLALQLILPFPLLINCFITGFDSVTVNILLGLSSLLALSVGAAYLFKVPKHGWAGAWELAAVRGGVKEITGERPKSGSPNLADKIFSKLLLVIVLILLLSVIRGVGVMVAKWKVGFDVLELDGVSVAILAGYGDRLILGGYQNNQYDGKIFVLPKNSEKISGVRRVMFKKFLPDNVRLPMLTTPPVTPPTP